MSVNVKAKTAPGVNHRSGGCGGCGKVRSYFPDAIRKRLALVEKRIAERKANGIGR
jgi:hypothetical protein